MRRTSPKCVNCPHKRRSHEVCYPPRTDADRPCRHGLYVTHHTHCRFCLCEGYEQEMRFKR